MSIRNFATALSATQMGSLMGGLLRENEPKSVINTNIMNFVSSLREEVYNNNVLPPVV
jgi:hypothetical protein